MPRPWKEEITMVMMILIKILMKEEIIKYHG